MLGLKMCFNTRKEMRKASVPFINKQYKNIGCTV